ncbi:kelch-like protein, partial [Corallococcus sp. AB004]
MQAMRAGRALLLGLFCVVIGCSKSPEEQTLTRNASPLVEGWNATADMAEARKYHAAVALNSSKVLVAGGYNTSGYLSSATLYDPGTGTWTAAAPMPEPRQVLTATLLPSG